MRVNRLPRFQSLRSSLLGKRGTPADLSSDQGGQVLVLGLIVAMGLVLVSISVANIGIMVAEKIHVQDTADAAAYSAATVEARYMNLTAYINRAMLANYNAMAFNTALWATVDAYDHGFAAIVSTLYLLAFIIQLFPPLIGVGQALDQVAYGIDKSVHNFFHVTNKTLNEWMDQKTASPEINNLIEIYNTDVLSTVEGVIYAAVQSSRYEVVKDVAKKMDPDVLTTSALGLAAETVSSDELREAVDWIIEDPDKRKSLLKSLNSAFDRAMGTDNDDDDVGGPTGDHVVLLGALNETTLDKFAAGHRRDGTPNLIRSFDFGDILPGWMKTAIKAFLIGECIASCVVTLGFGCDCDIDVEAHMGTWAEFGKEDKFSQQRVPVFARQRMREVNRFGLEVQMGFMTNNPIFAIPSSWGHTSGEKNADIGNVANKLEVFDTEWERFIECFWNSGKCVWNQPNIDLSQLTGGFVGSICQLIQSGQMVDDHWDGSFDPQPTCGTRYTNGQICVGDIIQYLQAVCSDGKEVGVPRYDWRTDLNNVGFTNYQYDANGAETRPTGTSGGGEGNMFTGPSIAVAVVKPASKIHGLNGLGIGNEYPITALSRAQVYYLRNPKRPNEKPSLFNPHWVPRLAPIDGDDSPPLLRYGLPYVMGFGVPVKPTH